MKVLNVFQTLRESYSQINNSLSDQSDALQSVFSNLDDPLEAVDFQYSVNDLKGHVYNLISDGGNLSLFLSDNAGNMTDIVVNDVSWSEIDLSEVFTNVGGDETSLQDILSNINNGYNINCVLNLINEQLLNYGSVQTQYVYQLLNNYDIDSESKNDILGLIQNDSDKISARSWSFIVSNLYKTISSADDSPGITQLSLNDQRGAVAGFWLTVKSINVVGTVANFAGMLLALIPNTITRVLGVATTMLGSLVNKVLSYSTTYNYDDSAMYPCVSAPFSVNTLTNDTTMNDVEVDGPVLSMTSPFAVLSAFKRSIDNQGNFQLCYNANFNVSLKVSAIKRILNGSAIVWDTNHARIDYGSTITDTQTIRNGMIDSIELSDFIDYQAGEGLMDDESRARHVAANIAFALLCAAPRLRFSTEKSIVSGFDEDHYVIYGSNASGYVRFTTLDADAKICKALHWFMYLTLMNVTDRGSMNSWGIDSIGVVSDLINFIQDNQNSGITRKEAPINYVGVSSEAFEVLYDFGPGFAILLAYAAGRQNFINDNKVYLNSVPVAKDFVYSLPNYDRATLFLALSTVALVTGATCAVIFGVKAKAKKWLFKQQMSSAKKLADLSDAYKSNPTDANLENLYRATKTYNFKAKILGFPGYDPINSWYDSPNANNSASSISLNYISRLITG